MDRTKMTRRWLLSAAAGLGLGMAVGPALLVAEADQALDEAFPKDAEEARRRLIAGNKRFVAGESVHPHASKEWRKRLTTGQKPFAAILGCSDSRVPPELIFDQGFGDLFDIRVAGNVIAPDVLGSLQYADVHLHISLLIVLGHESCGAVAAALAAKFQGAKEPERITALVRMIEPGLKGIDPKLPAPAQLNTAVEANVRWSMAQLGELPDVKKSVKEKRFEMVGAVYQLETGAVRFMT